MGSGNDGCFSTKFLTQRQFPQLAKVKVELADDSMTLSVRDGIMMPLSFTPTLQGREIALEIWHDRTIALVDGDRVAHWFQQVLELDSTKQCRLVRQSPQYERKIKKKILENQSNIVSFADGYPCLLTTTASLKKLNRRIVDVYHDSSTIVGMDRFRSNIVVETEIPFDEDSWKTVRIGEVKFRITKPCSRCIMTTIDQQKSDRDKFKEPLRTPRENIDTLWTGFPRVRVWRNPSFSLLRTKYPHKSVFLYYFNFKNWGYFV